MSVRLQDMHTQHDQGGMGPRELCLLNGQLSMSLPIVNVNVCQLLMSMSMSVGVSLLQSPDDLITSQLRVRSRSGICSQPLKGHKSFGGRCYGQGSGFGWDFSSWGNLAARNVSIISLSNLDLKSVYLSSWTLRLRFQTFQTRI